MAYSVPEFLEDIRNEEPGWAFHIGLNFLYAGHGSGRTAVRNRRRRGVQVVRSVQRVKAQYGVIGSLWRLPYLALHQCGR